MEGQVEIPKQARGVSVQGDAMLDGYRVLDLIEGGCIIAGQIFGGFGADVIKIEPPGGSPTRRIGPFYKDIPHPEKSLFWFAYSANKRGITLDIEKADGRDIFKKLVKSADIVLESFPPGYMDSIGLGYTRLCQVKPDIILTSITPYGQEGPKSKYKGSDLTAWAASVVHWIAGDPDRAPTWISWPCAGLNGGIHGVIASLFALWHREMTGEGQHVDAPIQRWLLQHTTGSYWWWECMRLDIPRMGPRMRGARATATMIRLCKDGYVHCLFGGGAAAGMAASSKRLVQWMDEEGMAPDWLKRIDWAVEYDTAQITQEEVDRLSEPVDKFFLTKTAAEISEEAAKRGFMACPTSNAKDICEDPQLKARHFWEKVEHPELGDTLTYCGPFVKLSEAAIKIFRRAPLIGEHNEQIYERELGLSREELTLLKQAGVI